MSVTWFQKLNFCSSRLKIPVVTSRSVHYASVSCIRTLNETVSVANCRLSQTILWHNDQIRCIYRMDINEEAANGPQILCKRQFGAKHRSCCGTVVTALVDNVCRKQRYTQPLERNMFTSVIRPHAVSHKQNNLIWPLTIHFVLSDMTNIFCHR